jgi:hypothetical protein
MTSGLRITISARSGDRGRGPHDSRRWFSDSPTDPRRRPPPTYAAPDASRRAMLSTTVRMIDARMIAFHGTSMRTRRSFGRGSTAGRHIDDSRLRAARRPASGKARSTTLSSTGEDDRQAERDHQPLHPPQHRAGSGARFVQELHGPDDAQIEAQLSPPRSRLVSTSRSARATDPKEGCQPAFGGRSFGSTHGAFCDTTGCASAERVKPSRGRDPCWR